MQIISLLEYLWPPYFIVVKETFKHQEAAPMSQCLTTWTQLNLIRVPGEGKLNGICYTVLSKQKMTLPSFKRCTPASVTFSTIIFIIIRIKFSNILKINLIVAKRWQVGVGKQGIYIRLSIIIILYTYMALVGAENIIQQGSQTIISLYQVTSNNSYSIPLQADQPASEWPQCTQGSTPLHKVSHAFLIVGSLGEWNPHR